MADERPPAQQLTDEDLAALVAQRDRAALSALYDRHVQPVYALAAHLLGRDEAEEIVQEIFLRLWNKADQFDPERGSFRIWFLAIARHRVLDVLRRRGQRQIRMAGEEIDRLLAQVPDSRVNVEEEVWLRERARAVLRALALLPEEQRRVLVLAYFGGLSQSAIAAALQSPLGTVKKRTRLGLQKLRTALMSEGLMLEAEDLTNAAGAVGCHEL